MRSNAKPTNAKTARYLRLAFLWASVAFIHTMCRTFAKNEYLAIKCDQIADRSVTDVSLPCFSNRLSGEVWNLSWEVAWSCRSSFLLGSPLFSQSDFSLVRRCSIFTGISYFFVCRSITGVIKFNIYILNHFRMLALQGHCPLVLPYFGSYC